jgi:hypothetical protein
LILVLAASCGTKATSSLESNNIDTRGNDVTVLQAWLGSTVSLRLGSWSSGDYILNPSDCTTMREQRWSSSQGEVIRRDVDCTDAYQNAARVNGGESPVLNKILMTYDQIANTNSYYTVSGMCELFEFRTVSPRAVVDAASFKGIGFYASTSRYNDHYITPFIAKDSLHEVGSVTLKDGRPGAVHRFTMQGMCFGTGGNGGTIADRAVKFRPYAQFYAQDTDTVYSVWDDVATDYLLGRNRDLIQYVFVRNFDRQSELLKQ